MTPSATDDTTGLIDLGKAAKDIDADAEDPLTQLEEKGNVPGEPLFSLTFHVETIRLIAYSCMGIMLGVCGLITEFYVNKELMDPTTTVIYETFGFNHVCNWFDHNPARQVASVLIPTMSIPMILYIFLFYMRLYRACKIEKSVPMYVLWFSRIVSPYNAGVMAILHLWFVNPPDGEYGFLGHYIPYLMFQFALSLMGIQQVMYLTHKHDTIFPCGIKKWMAWVYVSVFTFCVIASFVSVLSILSGTPLMDPRNDPTALAISQALAAIIAIMIFVMPIIFAVLERRDGDVNTITYG